jgi:hypothetical protein
VTVPTGEETLRIKAFLVVRRNQNPGLPVRQLSDPQPVDRSVIDQLSSYRRLRRRWSDWSAVREVLGTVAARMVSR